MADEAVRAEEGSRPARPRAGRKQTDGPPAQSMAPRRLPREPRSPRGSVGRKGLPKEALPAGPGARFRDPWQTPGEAAARRGPVPADA